MARSDSTSKHTHESTMNPCAASFRPGGACDDNARQVVLQDLADSIPPEMASMTPPDEEQVQEPLFTPLSGLFIPDGRYHENVTQEPNEHIYQISNNHTVKATLPSPANSPPNNTGAFMPPLFDLASNLENLSGYLEPGYLERVSDLYSAKRRSTPLLVDKSQIFSAHSDIFPSATNPIMENPLSSNTLFPQSENQPARNALLSSNPMDTELPFLGKVFQPELYTLCAKDDPYQQAYPAWEPLWPLYVEQPTFQSLSTETTRALENLSLDSPCEYKEVSFISGPSQNPILNMKSASNPPLFGQTQPCPISSQQPHAGNQELAKPKYKLVDTISSYPRGEQDRRLRAKNNMDPTNPSKSLESINTPTLVQDSNLLNNKTSSVVDKHPLNSRPGTVEKARPQLGDGIKDAINILIKQRQPPANAPTAPASLRRSQLAAQRACSLSAQPAEAGTWSQSKRWVSQESRERAAFQKMKLHLQYMGADKSPAIPQSPAELAAFRLETTSIKTRKLTRDIVKRQELSQRKKEGGGNDDAKPQPKAVLLNDKKFDDVLSPFFATESWFNESQPGGPEAQAKWPTMAEFKEDGDIRAPRHGRYFPLPRVEVAFTPTQDHESGLLYGVDTNIKRGKGAIKCDSRFILPVSSDLLPPADAPEDSEARVPPFFYRLVDSIENQYQEDEETEDN